MINKTKPALKNFTTSLIALSGMITAAGITLSAQSAQALDISFGTTDFNITQGVGNNNANASSVINTTAAPDGFGSAFTAPFLLLGASPGDTLTSDTFRTQNSTAFSIPFNITTADAAKTITMTFNWAFQGNGTGISPNADSFDIILTGPNDYIVFQRVAPSQYGFGINQTKEFLPDTVIPGEYQVLISLNEGTGPRNSAAGFNSIAISTPPEPVPFGFSTNASLLVFGSVFYGFHQFRKKHSIKKA